MTPEMCEKLRSIGMTALTASSRFVRMALENKPGIEGRLERLEASRNYASICTDIMEFLKKDEMEFISYGESDNSEEFDFENFYEADFNPECPPEDE